MRIHSSNLINEIVCCVSQFEAAEYFRGVISVKLFETGCHDEGQFLLKGRDFCLKKSHTGFQSKKYNLIVIIVELWKWKTFYRAKPFPENKESLQVIIFHDLFLLKVELHDREKRLLIAQASELQESVQSLQKELGMS